MVLAEEAGFSFLDGPMVRTLESIACRQYYTSTAAKALELFMIPLVTKVAPEGKDRNLKRVTTSHLKHAVAKDEVLDILADIIAKVPDQPVGRKHEDDGSDQNEGRRKRSGRAIQGGERLELGKRTRLAR
ncbi:uncharacterized protein N7498_005983 [Penicillium cinerascens]|uniref:Histone H2A n=1 Tax=Penicillium cinerascens TaxID=70096 RepID=A0A9W9MPJ7_9EURO|nr:uncharacterized protein N7498_005983 [Penicillium cinerascens]KAJ5205104.1 hypothetical protein N7498_005983 [Penicillium cinerascens]